MSMISPIHTVYTSVCSIQPEEKESCYGTEDTWDKRHVYRFSFKLVWGVAQKGEGSKANRKRGIGGLGL